jgi:hypothetical protein
MITARNLSPDCFSATGKYANTGFGPHFAVIEIGVPWCSATRYPKLWLAG